MLDDFKGMHLELTNICTLKCPRCSRTKFLEQFGTKNWTNSNLNLEHLMRFVDVSLQDKNIVLCGNYGDPIYYPDLFDLVSWLKKSGSTINIVTNGSYKKAEWWTDLSNLLTAKDTVTMSIDGLPENFTEYRINADWDSIESGISILAKSDVRLHWKYIPFSFNEHCIQEAKRLSQDLGFDKFIVSVSDRWESDYDYLKPSTVYGKREKPIHFWRHGTPVDQIDAKCKSTHSEHYISANGFYGPCCYSADHRFYYKSDFFKTREKYDISSTTLSKILIELSDFYSDLENQKYEYCTFNCPKI